MNNLVIMTFTICHASLLVLRRDWMETFTHLLFTFNVKQFGAVPAPPRRLDEPGHRLLVVRCTFCRLVSAFNSASCDTCMQS